jgi:hypothetical protein
MQLRVARLCLDCEELHVDSSCPICASERYAFLSSWLPVEERRRWRRPPSKTAAPARGRFQTLKQLLSRWFGDGEPESTCRGPRTRASDFVPSLDFDDPGTEAEPRQQPAHAREVLKHDR